MRAPASYVQVNDSFRRFEMLARDFTDEQQMFREAYRKFLAAEIVPHMESWREAGIIDREAFRKAGELGFLMVWPDEKYGGTRTKS